MDSSCFPAGFSYLTAVGMGVLAVVVSSWLVLFVRAVYRDHADFRRGFFTSAPLWGPGLGGIVALFLAGDSLVGWVNSCLPDECWNAVGVLFIGVGLALALTAAVRLIIGRARVGGAGEYTEDSDEDSSPSPSADPGRVGERRPNMPPERRRVIVEYAITYGAAVLVILIGVGLV